MKYPHLFAPGKIGNIEVKNRYVMTAMGTRSADENGDPSPKTLAYYSARAKGGVGLIVTGAVQVERSLRNAGGSCLANRDERIPGLKALADAVHAQGAKIVMQLVHPGARNPMPGPIPTPSGIAAFPNQTAREMTQQEIRDMIEDFTSAALRVKQAGFDGVEFHGAHNYLIHNFLSPHFNHRTDAYGGSFENRFRFLKEIYEGAREKVGPDFPILVRISADEYLPDGHHLDEGIKVAMELEKLGVAAVDVSVGGASNGRSHTIEPMSYPEGWRKHLALAVKKMVRVPVIATTVIRHPAYAETLLAEGYMDFVGCGRNNLADPEWMKKAMEGREVDIRHCISCCRCIEGLAEGSIGCSVNPLCGREWEEGPLTADGAGKTALVVGGGPAGLEAARTLAERGFAVTLFEKTDHLGGQMHLASHVPYKEKMLWFVDWQRDQLAKLGVQVKLNTAPAARDLLDKNPDVVIDATGAEPIRPASIPGVDLPLVKTPVDVLTGSFLPKGKHIAVIGSGLTGLETAEVLAANGNMVKVLEMAETIAPGGSAINTGEATRRLYLDNVVLQTNRKLTKIEDDRIYFADGKTGEDYVMPVDAVVLSLGVKSTASLEKELAGKCRVLTVGDAHTPSRIKEAVLAGHLAAIEA